MKTRWVMSVTLIGLVLIAAAGGILTAGSPSSSEDGALVADGAKANGPARRAFQALLGNDEGKRSAALPTFGPDARAPFEPPTGIGIPSLDEARAGFELAMENVTARAGEGRISQDAWKQVYREANDAFAALSMQLDARDPQQRQELETAHRRLLATLNRVRVRGGK